MTRNGSLRCAPWRALLPLAVLLSACAGQVNPIVDEDSAAALSAQTPARMNATPADYRGNDCYMLGRFLGVMQQGYRVTVGFPQKVYGWHVDAIQQVQQEKGCANVQAGTSANPVVSGHLGVQFEALTPAMARTLGMRNAYGALVVEPGVGQTGLHARDVVVEISGQRVQTPLELQSIVGLMAPGYKAPLAVWRDGALVKLTIEVTAPGSAVVQAAK
ncbi:MULTISPECIES: PDZ domain-containing protein [unclassified Variovorax]|uniref:PDZ domain-containing protein n=1 Tax=unclassified Variovorax TaxID=663243 RepID=UPI001BD3141B|nr:MULTISPECIES: PDZ domain-containing protein [unclassified Variovorax]